MQSVAKTVTENRSFQMHRDLLWSVITAQAGSPEKALLEAIMNSVDAGATACDIELDGKGFIVRDDGKGFSGQHEIIQFFETFGTPHIEGDATYGKFRMGRGQLFAFATTQWRTGSFRMCVDIKSQGLSYELQSDLESVPGCEIVGTWYDSLDAAEVIRLSHELSKLAHWMQIPIRLAGRSINKCPQDSTWDIDCEYAYIALKPSGGLSVYNLGALVRNYPPNQFGLSGIVVSKKTLQINLARNDILLAKCSVWKSIRKHLDKHAGTLIKKKNLDDYERDSIAAKFVRGEYYFFDVCSVSLIVDITGRKHSLRALSDWTAICDPGNPNSWRIGERVMDQKLAFVVHPRTYSRFHVESLAELIELLQEKTELPAAEQAMVAKLSAERYELTSEHQEIWPLFRRLSQKIRDSRATADDVQRHSDLERLIENNRAQSEVIGGEILRVREGYPDHGEGYFNNLKIVSLEVFTKHISDNYEILDDKTLSPHQKAIHQALQRASECIASSVSFSRDRSISRDREDLARRILVGQSDVAQAWTDGERFIVINLNLIKKFLTNEIPVDILVNILVHEYCHEESDQGSHLHTQDFYEKFHNYACHSIVLFSSARMAIISGYANCVLAEGRLPRGTMMSELKNQEKLSTSLSME